MDFVAQGIDLTQTCNAIIMLVALTHSCYLKSRMLALEDVGGQCDHAIRNSLQAISSKEV